MNTAIFKSDSEENLKLLMNVAKKLGIKAKILTNDEIEEIGLANAIRVGKTNESVSVHNYLKKIRK